MVFPPRVVSKANDVRYSIAAMRASRPILHARELASSRGREGFPSTMARVASSGLKESCPLERRMAPASELLPEPLAPAITVMTGG